jgi:hypothetical protein
MVFAPVACGGTFRGRLSPHNFAAPCSKLKAPEVLHERGKSSEPLPAAFTCDGIPGIYAVKRFPRLRLLNPPGTSF